MYQKETRKQKYKNYNLANENNIKEQHQQVAIQPR